MSLVLTESWVQFARTTAAFAPSAATVFAWSPNKWAYQWSGSSASHFAPGSVSWVADPVFPSRNRLYVQMGAHADYWGAFSLSCADTSVSKRRFGFLFRMLPSAVPKAVSFGAGTVVNRAGAYYASHPVFTQFFSVIAFYTAANSTEVKLSHSATGVSTALSYALTTGTDYYVEVEMDTSAGTYRVWVDDYLLIDAAMSAAAKTAMLSSWGWSFNTINGMYASAAPGAYLSDIYYLRDDGVAPSARLGKTARVKGELPSGDVSVQFDRPSGFTANYDVIDGQLSSVAAPTTFLTGSGVGAKDVYSVPIDTYAAQVYAMSVKTIAANFSSAAHQLSAVIADADSSATVAMGTLAAGAAFAPMGAVFTTDPDGNAWTPISAAACNFGLQVTS